MGALLLSYFTTFLIAAETKTPTKAIAAACRAFCTSLSMGYFPPLVNDLSNSVAPKIPNIPNSNLREGSRRPFSIADIVCCVTPARSASSLCVIECCCLSCFNCVPNSLGEFISCTFTQITPSTSIQCTSNTCKESSLEVTKIRY